MKSLIHSEYLFDKMVGEEAIQLTLYINYDTMTYDFMQNEQEGVFPRLNNQNAEINKGYFELGLEVLAFVEKELFNE